MNDSGGQPQQPSESSGKQRTFIDVCKEKPHKWLLAVAFILVLVIGVSLSLRWSFRGQSTLVYTLLAAGAVLTANLWWDDKGKGWGFRRWVLALVMTVLAAALSVGIKKAMEGTEQSVRWKIVLVGEAKYAHWDSFKDGFKLVLAKAEYGQIGSLKPNVLGSFRLGERQLVDVTEELLPDDDADGHLSPQFQLVMKRIKADDSILGVVGFVTSTHANAALDCFEKKKGAWPMVILPMATKSQLLQDHNRDGSHPVLRLVPPNSAQLKPMVSEILESGKQGSVSLAIFRDAENPEYSADLAKQLRAAVEKTNVAVVFDGPIGPNGPGMYVTDSFVTLHPDYVAFLGMLNTGIPLVRQIRRMESFPVNVGQTSNFWDPVILLSDGSVEKNISLSASTDELKGIRGFFPHGEPSAHAKQCTGGDFATPSYTMFGHDAAVFAHEALRLASIESAWLTRGRVREALKRIQDDWNSNQSPLKGKVLMENYLFDVTGDVTNLMFQVWVFDGTNWVTKSKRQEGLLKMSSRTGK